MDMCVTSTSHNMSHTINQSKITHNCAIFIIIFTMAGPMFPVFPSEYESFSGKCLLLISETDSFDHLLTTAKCFVVAKHNDKTCNLSPKCKFHVLVYDENVKNSLDILQKHYRGFHVNYQQVDCLYTLFKYYIADEIIQQNGELFSNLTKVVRFNKIHKHMETLPSIAKKRLFRKSLRFYSPDVSKKTIGTQTQFKNSFESRINAIRKSKYELDLIKIIDCMLDQAGVVDGANVYFVCK